MNTIFGSDPATLTAFLNFANSLTKEENDILDALQDDPESFKLKLYFDNPNPQTKATAVEFINRTYKLPPPLKTKLLAFMDSVDPSTRTLQETIINVPSQSSSVSIKTNDRSYVGAGSGALAGFYVGGPVGAIVGGILGWVVGSNISK